MSNDNQNQSLQQILSTLEQVNADLALLLEDNEMTTERSAELLALAGSRAELIELCLHQLHGTAKREFAQTQHALNETFEKRSALYLSQAKDEAVNFVRSKKLAKKYNR